MLSGIKFIDKDLAARSLEADKRASKKEKKQLKKVTKIHSKRCACDSLACIVEIMHAEAVQDCFRRRENKRRLPGTLPDQHQVSSQKHFHVALAAGPANQFQTHA